MVFVPPLLACTPPYLLILPPNLALTSPQGPESSDRHPRSRAFPDVDRKSEWEVTPTSAHRQESHHSRGWVHAWGSLMISSGYPLTKSQGLEEPRSCREEMVRSAKNRAIVYPPIASYAGSRCGERHPRASGVPREGG
jgi:hypothetical protein